MGAFGGIIGKNFIAVIVALMMQFNVADATAVAPQDVAAEFMTGVTTCDEEYLQRYQDNQYVNFLLNIKAETEAEKKLVKRLDKALFKNFTYEIVDYEQRETAAVVKVEIKGNNFSKVLENYEAVSYDYVTSNLYSETVEDKQKLNEKCLEIYVEQVEKAAKKKPKHTATIYIPMLSNGSNGWDALATDEAMKEMFCGLKFPK